MILNIHLIILYVFLLLSADFQDPDSFPTRRSSDLIERSGSGPGPFSEKFAPNGSAFGSAGKTRVDRKSTRLNSSHVEISYAVFCLKKKKNILNIVFRM